MADVKFDFFAQSIRAYSRSLTIHGNKPFTATTIEGADTIICKFDGGTEITLDLKTAKANLNYQARDGNITLKIFSGAYNPNSCMSIEISYLQNKMQIIGTGISFTKQTLQIGA